MVKLGWEEWEGLSGCCPGRWISIQGHPMSRPAFSHRHTLGQFRSPIQSTRHTQLINRSPPAAEACGVRLFASEGCKEISGGQHASPPCPCDGCLCVDVRRHLQLPSDRARSGGHMQPDHKRGCVSGEMKREGCQLPHLRYSFRFNHGNSTLGSTQLGSGARQKMQTTR